MTIMIDPQGGAPASDVWDVPRAVARPAKSASVRTLEPAYRTLERDGVATSARAYEPAAGFEPGRERRDNLALGGLMAAALIVGSLFGGVFGADHGPATANAVVEAGVQAR